MKKLIAVSILFTILSAAVFGQFSVSLNADLFPVLMTATAPLDYKADLKKDYAGTGTFDFFNNAGWKGNNLLLSLKYNDPDGMYTGYIRLNASALVPTNGSSGFFTNSGLTVDDLFSKSFDEYSITGKVGIITGYFGNTADRGKVDRYQNFSDFQDGVKSDHYGILAPGTIVDNFTAGQVSTLTFATYDVNNIRTRAPSTGVSYVGAKVDLNPITVDLAGGLGAISNGSNASWSKGNAAIRVSGTKLADIVTFDVIYKISGADEDTDKNDEAPGTGPEPDGNGEWDNAFGVYANIDVVNGLGIGVGYSGSVKVTEDRKVGDDIYKTVNPFYSGIDLRFAFTGVDKLTVTFNNNISFTGVTGDDDAKTTIKGVSVSDLGKDVKESYLGLYNALGVNYKITDAVTARAEIINRLGSYTWEAGANKGELTYDKFRTVLSAAYSANSHVRLEGGLAFDIDHTSNKHPNEVFYGSKEYKGGLFTFAIPLRLQVVF